MDIERVIEGLDQLFAKRQIDKVEEYLSSALEQALKEGDVGSAITIINELIGYYRDTSQYDKAEVYCEKLLPFMEKAGLAGTVHYGTSCLNIANAYRASGRFSDSLKHYQMVFDIYENVLEDKDFRYASLNNNLSLLYQEMGEFDKACEALNRALQIVKEYPEAVVELGVTYTNLAASYIKAGKIEQAKDAVNEGLSIFQNGLQEDYHYSAALSVAGDVYFAEKDYDQAVQCFEQAMLALKKHVGITHAYFRIVSNLKTAFAKLGTPDKLQGLVIARDYYEEYGKRAFASIQEIDGITFAKVGEGSECFGLDDIFSMDHDFGPGFCVFVTKKQYEEYGTELEACYASLPDTFRGLEKPDRIEGAPRNGIIMIEEFFKRILELNDKELAYLLEEHTLTDEVWLRVSDWQLCTVTNGDIFDGRDSLFSSIYTSLKRGYPDHIKRRKMAQMLGVICQSGQYNYERMMKRGDEYGAILLLHDFAEAVMGFLYLVNDQYAPHKKWLMREGEFLQKGKDIFESLKILMKLKPDISIYQKRDMVDWIGITNKEDRILSGIEKIAEKITALLKEEGYTKSDAVYLEQQIPYLLEMTEGEQRK